jgi:hypothetical protein
MVGAATTIPISSPIENLSAELNEETGHDSVVSKVSRPHLGASERDLLVKRCGVEHEVLVTITVYIPWLIAASTTPTTSLIKHLGMELNDESESD